ncbi:MAG: 2-amino-4-hydroxy-6-hydroxymethyldihydropteridine diphosphokinase [Prevotella sp.]|nr:2-amino-4-hydroxy-6-hydroxymethyldihydropteridine diphosphokinase [Prevotella sp.]
MHEIIIALGSNTDNSHCIINKAINALNVAMVDIQPTRILDNESVDFIKECIFSNALVKGKCALELEEISNKLKEIETKFGRTKTDDAKGNIVLDLDLLKYDNIILHERDWKKGYINVLLEELR